MTEEEVIRAVRWALAVPADPADDHLWAQFIVTKQSQEKRRHIARALGQMFEQGILFKLRINMGTLQAFERELVESFLHGAGGGTPARNLARKLSQILYGERHHPKSLVMRHLFPRRTAPEVLEGGAVFPKHSSAQPSSVHLNHGGLPDMDKPQQNSEPPTPTPATEEEVPRGVGLWKYLEITDDGDRHGDFAAKSISTGSGLRVIGARVRGRKHKHDGTNCDDWFEISSADDWTIIAVSDGAGSCALSRVGAKISTGAAAAYLREKLDGVVIMPSIESADRQLERDESGSFIRDDIRNVQNTLHEAVERAHTAVHQEAERRSIDPKSMSSTLRLAVHRRVPGKDQWRDFVLACSVGDGMTALIDESGSLHLLGAEESGGKYSGETEFVTDPRTIAPDRLMASTFPALTRLRSLMVMSDGVADPYFPNHPGMLRLFADLVLNAVVVPDADGDEPKMSDAEIDAFSYVVDVPTAPDEKESVMIRQSDRLVEQSGETLAQLLQWPPRTLIRGAAGSPMTKNAAGAPAEDRLRIWLDSFYVRGEFDDRTLVVMHRESGR